MSLSLSYVESTIRESLRLDVLVPSGLPHTATADTNYQEYDIPKVKKVAEHYNRNRNAIELNINYFFAGRDYFHIIARIALHGWTGMGPTEHIQTRTILRRNRKIFNQIRQIGAVWLGQATLCRWNIRPQYIVPGRLGVGATFRYGYAGQFENATRQLYRYASIRAWISSEICNTLIQYGSKLHKSIIDETNAKCWNRLDLS